MREAIGLRSRVLNRRDFLTLSAALANVARADVSARDPWPKSALIEPAALAQELSADGQQLHIICVTFPSLYRQKHILHAQFAGPTNKPEGIAHLQAAVESLPKDASVAIYCGCCPMNVCPNIRPAYRALREQGFKETRVLNLPTDFHTDWVVKGYPIEA